MSKLRDLGDQTYRQTDIYLIYLLIPIQIHHQKILLKSFGYMENITQLTYQKHVMYPDKKKNIIRGIANIRYWMKIGYFVKNHSTKRRKISCNSLLGHLDAHLILSRIFLVYILLYSLAVLWYISLQYLLATNLDLWGYPNILMTVQDVGILARIIEEVINKKITIFF